jgi:hypothetical protein
MEKKPIQLSDITCQELMLRGERLLEHVAALAGYDECALYYVSLDPDEPEMYSIKLRCEDNFQDNLDYTLRFHVGILSFPYSLEIADPKLPIVHPLREERELGVLSRKNSGNQDLADQMKSASAQNFTYHLVEAQRQMGLRIKDMREERERDEA